MTTQIISMSNEVKKIKEFKDAVNWVNKNNESIDKMEEYIKKSRKKVVIEICTVIVSIVLGLMSIFQKCISNFAMTIIVVAWIVPLVIICVYFISERNQKIGRDYLLLAIYDYRKIKEGLEISE